MKKNIFFIFFGWIVPVVVFFLLTPYLIKNLGNEVFGIFTLINVVTGYVSFINFGFGQAVTKYISKYKAQKRLDDINKALAVSILFFISIGIFGLFIMYFGATLAVDKVFNISNNLKNSSIIAFKIGSFGFLFNMLTEVLRGLCIGFNNFFLPNFFRSLRVLLSSFFMVYAIVNYGSLHYVLAGNVIGQLLSLIINFVFTLRLFKPLKFSFDLDLLKDMINYSKYVFATKMLNFTLSEIGIVLLGIIKTTIDITFYTIPQRLLSRGFEILNRLFEILFPLSSKLDALNKKTDLTKIYFKMVKLQLLIILPIIIVVVFQGKWILATWINYEFAEKCYLVLVISCFSGLISMLTNLPSYYSMGLGYPEYTTKFTFYRFILIMIPIFPLTYFYGYIGVALSMLLGEIQGLFFIFFVPSKILNKKLFPLIKYDILKYLAIGFIFSFLYFNLKFIFKSYELFIYQFCLTIVLMLLYIILILLFKLISINEIKVAIINVKK